jgi:DNA-binding beta-propeller fold protein YncE
MAALRAASEAFAGQSERLIASDRDRALAEALKGLPLAAPPDEPAFAAARRAYQKAARTVIARLPIDRGATETQALVSADGQRIAVLQGLSFSLWDARGPRRVSGVELTGDNALRGSEGRTSSSPVMAFSPDGRHVAVFNPGPRQIVSFDASTGAPAARFSVNAQRAPMGLALSNGGRRVLAYHMESASVLDASGQTLLEVRSPRIGSADIIALSPDGREAAFLDEPRPRADSPRVFAQVDAYTDTTGARPMALHRYDLTAGRLIWSSAPTARRSADYFHVSYTPRDDYVLFATPSGAFPNHSVTVFARTTNAEVARGGPFANEIDSISYDGAYATERDAIYAFPALTRVDGRALATPPVIHRVFGNDNVDLGGRIFAWPAPAPQSSAALEAARTALAPALASAVAEQRLAYKPMPAPQK